MKKLLAVVVLLCVASVASADLQMVVTETTDADHTAAGLRAFKVSFVGTTASKDEFNAIDGNLSGDLSQCWFGGATSTPGLGSPWTLIASPAAEKLDTHMLVDLAGADVLLAKKPTEDSDLPGGVIETIDGYQRGMGTKMTGPDGTENFSYAIQASAQALSTDVLQVVVPATGNAHLSATVVAQDSTPVLVEYDFIPEPATLGLLAVGGIGALIRRRRR